MKIKLHLFSLKRKPKTPAFVNPYGTREQPIIPSAYPNLTRKNGFGVKKSETKSEPKKPSLLFHMRAVLIEDMQTIKRRSEQSRKERKELAEREREKEIEDKEAYNTFLELADKGLR